MKARLNYHCAGACQLHVLCIAIMSDQELKFDSVTDLLIKSSNIQFIDRFKAQGFDDSLLVHVSPSELVPIFGDDATGHRLRFWREVCKYKSAINAEKPCDNAVIEIHYHNSESNQDLESDQVAESELSVAESDQTMFDVTSLGHSSQSSDQQKTTDTIFMANVNIFKINFKY